MFALILLSLALCKDLIVSIDPAVAPISLESAFGVRKSSTLRSEGRDGNLESTERVLFEPVASGKGTVPCKHWPSFDLYNYNSNSASYLNSFGLEDMKEADVTIVGLYLADDVPSQNKIKRHADLKKTLEQMEIKLKGSKGKRRLAANVAAINYFSPMSCATKKCKSTGSSNYWLSWIWGNDECYDVIGGCPTGYYGGKMDTALLESNWQAKLADGLPAFMPILQDLDYIDVWDAFGGQSGDLFIYDNVGRLYAYVCSSADSCNHPMPGNTIAVQSGFDYVLELAKDAAKSDGSVRCKRYIEGDSDDLPADYATQWSTDNLDKAAVNDAPEEDDDWVDGKSKSAQAAEQAAGTANIGNAHPSDYDPSKRKSGDKSTTTEGEYTGNPSDGGTYDDPKAAKRGNIGDDDDTVDKTKAGTDGDGEGEGVLEKLVDVLTGKQHDYSSNAKRGTGPKLKRKGGVIDHGRVKRQQPNHRNEHPFFWLLVISATAFLCVRYKRYKDMHASAADGMHAFQQLPQDEGTAYGNEREYGWVGGSAVYGTPSKHKDGGERSTLL